MSECLFCGESEGIESHHIVPARFGGTRDKQNLIDLCSPCHSKVESAWDARFYHAIGVRDGMTPDMMFDFLKDITSVLIETKSALTGQYNAHDQLEEYASDEAEKRRHALMKESVREMLEGDGWMGTEVPIDRMEELQQLSLDLQKLMEDNK